MKDKKHNIVNGNTDNKRSRQKGFALLEVLLAALVMAIGSVAFLELQSVNLKSGNNNFARNQAVMMSSGFVERLRSNQSFLGLSAADRSGSIVGGSIGVGSVTAPQGNADCDSGRNTRGCVQATLNYQRYLTSLQMGSGFPPNLSLLCYVEDDTAAAVSGYLRMTFLWRDNLSRTKTALTAGDCPANFDSVIPAVNRDNSVTIYAQL